MLPDIQSLKSLEWYDNHKLALILNCPRKAFYHLHWAGGLSLKVGPGADFGWCMHAGLAVFNKLVHTDWQRACLAAYRAFDAAYKQKFPPGTETEKKHRLERGLQILDRYFTHFKAEDELYRCIEPEIGGMVPITPREGDRPDFVEPFYYTFRADGVFERVRSGDWFIKEYKTTGSGVDRELVRRQIDRQSTGYAYSLTEFEPDKTIMGVMVDAILVAAEKVEFKREFFRMDRLKLDAWRAQTINIVQDWRIRIGRAAFVSEQEQLAIFYQNDNECTSYGLCPYHKLCRFNPHHDLHEYEQNNWFPLE